MAGVRELLAAVLGIGLGIVIVAFPQFVVKIHTLGRGPQDRHGEFGTHAVEGKWLWVVRAIGVLVLLGGAYFGYVVLLA